MICICICTGRLHERSEQNRVKSLHAAFSLLDLNNDGMLQFGTVISVFHELNQHYSTHIYISDITVLWVIRVNRSMLWCQLAL